MKRKIIGIILVLALALSLPGVALATGDVRQTDFFTDVPHSQTAFADMEYRHIGPEPIQARIGEARELLNDAANARAVEELYDRISDDYLEMDTMKNLMEIRSSQDIRDEEAVAERVWYTEQEELLKDTIRALVRDIAAVKEYIVPLSGDLKELRAVWLEK